MAEEAENKQKVILNKKKNETQTGGAGSSTQEPERKKVVVVKKKPASAKTEETPVRKIKTVVSAGTQPQQTQSATEEKAAVQEQQHPDSLEKTASENKEQNRPAQTGTVQSIPNTQTQTVVTHGGVTSIELSPPRPNIKQGNLADKRGNRNAQNNQGQRHNDGNSSGGYQRKPREGGSGFTGAQAREDYKNRSGNGRVGFGGQGGRNGQGNFGGQNRGSNQNGRSGFGGQGGRNGQGNFGGQNRGGNQNGRSGFGGQTGRNGQGQGSFGMKGGFGSAPAPMEENKKVPAKKTFTKKKQVYNRKDREEDLEDKLFNQKKKTTTVASAVPEKIEIMENVSVQDLAKKMNLKASEIIGKLFSMGMMVSINQSIDADTATLLASEYNCDVHIVNLYDETVIETEEDKPEDMATRPPVVTIMGHVDHGKTKTLDAIRSANVVATEFGGITQHIGAYQVTTPKGTITFLDTPGHEAFTMMRARGAQITDIVVLVVAADDGVMPQTIEAINHAKDAKVPIVVAVNKVDKPEANPDRVMTQLSDLGLVPEEWGGDTQYVKISALKKMGLDELLDAILLQAEMLELKANFKCRAEGKVIESRIDHGRGVVSSIIVERGTLHQGDPYVAGIYAGRVRAIFNDRGQKITEASPSMPVEILGLEEMPMAGDPFQVTENEKEARAISLKRQELKRYEAAKAVKKVNLDNLYETIDAGEVQELKVIIKADVQGTAEALKTSLEKLSTKDIRLVVIHSSAGAINESDVSLAAADSNAIIVGFNVRPTPKAKLLADQEKVDIRKYNIIYKCVEEITAAMEGMLKPDVKEEVIGTLEVRETFKVPKVGIIAGAYVTSGSIKRSCSLNVIRDGIVVGSAIKIASLKRFKDDAKEVLTGFECGVGLVDFQDLKIGDQLEVIEYVEVARHLGDPLSKEAEAKKA